MFSFDYREKLNKNIGEYHFLLAICSMDLLTERKAPEEIKLTAMTNLKKGKKECQQH